MTRRYDFDLFVIGGGSGGVRLSRTASGLGAKVGLAEDDRMGGTCVNVGCVPKKLFVYGSRVRHQLADAAGFGWTVPEPTFQWDVLRDNQAREVTRLNGIYERIVSGAGVDVVRGRARVLDGHTVDVDGRRITAERIAVATGGTPRRPQIPGAELAIVSDDVFVLPRLPRSLVIVGAGYIACEFASIFHNLGVETTLVARGERLLPHFERECGLFVQDQMQKDGIRIVTERNVARLERRGDRIACVLDRVLEGGASELLAEQVFFAIGRTARLDALESFPLRCRPDGGLAVDDEFRTEVPSIYALGDVIARVQLTPVALAEGTAIARSLFGGKGRVDVDYRDIPTAIFTSPEVATVGMTEAHARSGHRVTIFRTDFRPMQHTLSGRDERTLMKLVVDAETDRILGCHMVGEGAGEMMQLAAVAMKAGATKAHFDATIGIHPTAAEEWVTMRTPIPEPN